MGNMCVEPLKQMGQEADGNSEVGGRLLGARLFWEFTVGWGHLPL